MKKSYLTLLTIAAGSYFMLSNNNGVATTQNKDRTGSPVGDVQLCNNCHSGAAFTTSIELRMKDALGNVVTTYDPGVTYTYEVEVSSTGASAYGFQTVGLLGTNAQAGTLTAALINTKTKVLSGRTYAEHNGKSVSGLFKMNWTAPAAGSGEVKFYATGLGCNANNSSSGDKFVKANALVLAENTISGIDETVKPSFNLYPQPVASDFFNLVTTYNGNTKLVLMDMKGSIVQTQNIIFVNGSPTRIDVQELNSGTYMLVVIGSEGQQLYSSKLIKQ